MSLETILFNQHLYPPSGVILRDEPKEQEMRAIVKQLVQKGLKLWDMAELRMAYGAPGKHDYRKWEGKPFMVNDKYATNRIETAFYDIPPQNLYPDMPNVGKIPDGVYTAVAEEVKKIERKNGRVNIWSTDRSKTILLVVETHDGQPTTILETYEIPKPQIVSEPYGPYLVQLSSNRWLRFNSDLTLCEVINLIKTQGKYQFTSETCPFNENGVFLPNALF